jgi:hypothetical protein
MSTQEVAKRFHELAQQGNWDQIYAELYSKDAESIEPSGAINLPNAKGLDKILEKGKLWHSMIEEIHGGYSNEPQAAGNFFVCTMGVELTIKGQPRSNMDEIALYEVRNGKIIKEQFFY